MNLEGYEIIKEINRGPVATVYLARQLALERFVFLKVLNQNIHDQPDLLERFKREAKICARLNHPNIVNIYEFGDADGAFFLIFEYVQGQTLKAFIKQHHPLPVPVVNYILYQVAGGLYYAHQHGVLHRDIKPANIMIGDDGQIKITDFGLATSNDLPGVTMQHMAVGTPAYMSPEQATGKPLDVRSDIFSLGITLYEMLTGQNPFLGENVVDSLNNVLTRQPEPVHALRPDCPPWLDKLVNRMLVKKPEDRLPSLLQLLENEHLKSNQIQPATFLNFLQNGQLKERSILLSETKSPHRMPFTKKKKAFMVLFVVVLIASLIIFLEKSVKPLEPSLPSVVTVPKAIDSVQSQTSNPEGTKPKTNIRSNQTGTIPEASNHAVPKAKVAKATTNEKINIESQSSAQLFIFCSPWADIYLNGRFVDTTPIEKPLFLKPGSYNLELRNPNFEILKRKVTLTAGSADTLHFKLKPKLGFLKLMSFPWGRVFIDDSLVGVTPIEIKITAGQHVLKIVNPKWATFQDTIWIGSGEHLEKRIQLKN